MSTQKSNPSAASLFQYEQSPFMKGEYQNPRSSFALSNSPSPVEDTPGQKIETAPSQEKKGPNDFQTGFEKGSAGGLGTGLTSAGMYATMGGNPYGLAAVGGGLIISGLEQKQKNKQIDEANRIASENQQRQAQISAINNLMGVARGLSV